MLRHAKILLGAGCLLAGLPGVALAQESRTEEELSLESLLNTPVSTAAKYEQKQTEAAAFVTIVTRAEIRRFGFRTVEQVLQHQIGFYSADDREYPEVGFRGVGRTGDYNNKVLLLVDGHSLNDSFTGGARLGTASVVDLDSVERIEIVRGPGSALYGARAMLAVVNLVTRKGRDIDGIEVTGDLGMLSAYGGSLQMAKVLGPTADVAASGSFGGDDGEDIYYPELDNPNLNGGWARDLDWSRYARGLLSLRSGNLFLQAGLSRREKGNPTGSYGTIFAHPDAENRDRFLYLESRYVHEIGVSAEVTARGYLDSYQNDMYLAIQGSGDAPTGDDNVLPAISRVRAGTMGSEVRLRWDQSESQRIIMGVEGQRIFEAQQSMRGGSGGIQGLSEPYHILSAFIHDELQVTPRLALTLGIRHDEYSIRGSATTPRGAVVFHANPTTTFKFLAGNAFRAPNHLETFIHYPEAALMGNLNLDPERIRSFEFVLDKRLPGAAVTAVVFHSDINDLIEQVEVLLPDSLAIYGRFARQYQNIANARSAGVDLEVRAGLPFGILAKAGYGLHVARDLSTDKQLVNAPLHQARITGSGMVNRLGEVGVTVRAESGRESLYGKRTNAYVVADVAVTSVPISDRFRGQLTIRNLFDTAYNVPGGFQHSQSAIPQMGRRITFRLTAAW